MKSSNRYMTCSLEKFRKKYGDYINHCVVLPSGEVDVKAEALYLPICMAGLL